MSDREIYFMHKRWLYPLVFFAFSVAMGTTFAKDTGWYPLKKSKVTHALTQAQPVHSSTTMAKTPSGPAKLFKPVVSLSLGTDVVRSGQEQTISLLPPFSNDYTASSHRNAIFDGGLFLGAEYPLNSLFNAQLGVAGYTTSNLTPSGDIWQFALPQFNNFSYRYTLTSQRLMLSGKLLGNVHSIIYPYISAEVGMGFIQAKNYIETPFIPEDLPMASFRNHSSNSFAYAFGFGFDVSMDKKKRLRLGLGYQFANLGKASLGLSPTQVTTETLQLPHLYTNQIRFQLTYLISG